MDTRKTILRVCGVVCDRPRSSITPFIRVFVDREARDKARMTQRELAAAVGIKGALVLCPKEHT